MNLGIIEPGEEFDEDGDLRIYCKSLVTDGSKEIFLTKQEVIELIEKLENVL